MRGTNCSGRPGTTSMCPCRITTGPWPTGAPTVAAITGRPLWLPTVTSTSRDSSQPFTKPAALWIPSSVDVS